ncbi:MAG: hypothetical protein GY728_12320, partial [Phycisphaeraceae bacterium]|nr:hypothetical protein [Phycisphaeraceae bacterium]
MQTALSNPDRVDPEDGEPDVEATEPEHSPAATGSIDDRLSNRVPLERQIELSFADFDGFVTECSMNISATGMFIRCDDPQPA